MYLFGQDENYILIECEKCGRVLKFDRKYFNSISDENCITTIPLQCTCGNKSENPILKKPSCKIDLDKNNSVLTQQESDVADEKSVNSNMYFRSVTNHKLFLRCGKCNHIIQTDDKIVSTYNDKLCYLNGKITCNNCANVSTSILEFDPEYAEIKKKLDKSNKRAGIGCMVIIGVIIIAIIFAFSKCSSGGSSSNGKIQAWTAATHAIELQLKSPSTAKFPWYSDSYITDNGDGTYTVSSYVDAENSFGAKLRSNWSCKVDSSGDVSDIYIDN